METFLIKAAQLIVALAFLVVIHEFGHYIIARAFGIKVEKFYLFFNPWFSLFKWKPKSKGPKYDKNGKERATWRDTEYGIGWLPLGGYVKIAGMIDESMDKEQMAQPEKPWEFRAKPAWQRLCVMIAGVMFNFILAILIYAGIAFFYGNKYVPLDKAYEGMDFTPAAREVGFVNGDMPILADGQPINASEAWFLYKVVDAKEVTVLRKTHADSLTAQGLMVVPRDTVIVNLPSDFIHRVSEDEGFMAYRLPVFVAQVSNGTPASRAGLEKGDRIVGIGGVPTPSYTELTDELKRNAGRETEITVMRGDKVLTLHATPSGEGKLGFGLMPLTEVYPTMTEHYSFFRSFPKGWQIGTETLGTYVSSLSHLFSKEGVQSVGGFGAIGSIFPEKWNWYQFWQTTAFLSVILAFMNIIPIPGLDGGHVMFLLWEVITRRKVNEKVLEYAQYAGMLFLLLLLVYANGNDIVRAFMD